MARFGQKAWRKVFEDGVKSSKIQDFVTCVQHTNASWLMDSGMFERRPSADLVERERRRKSKRSATITMLLRLVLSESTRV